MPLTSRTFSTLTLWGVFPTLLIGACQRPVPVSTAASAVCQLPPPHDSVKVGIELELHAPYHERAEVRAATDRVLQTLAGQFVWPGSAAPTLFGAPGIRYPLAASEETNKAETSNDVARYAPGVTAPVNDSLMREKTTVAVVATRVKVEIRDDGSIAKQTIGMSSYDDGVDAAMMAMLRRADSTRAFAPLAKAWNIERGHTATLDLGLSSVRGAAPIPRTDTSIDQVDDAETHGARRLLETWRPRYDHARDPELVDGAYVRTPSGTEHQDALLSFIIDEGGRPVQKSFFAYFGPPRLVNAVARDYPKSRFLPATIRGCSVRSVVSQHVEH